MLLRSASFLQFPHGATARASRRTRLPCQSLRIERLRGVKSRTAWWTLTGKPATIAVLIGIDETSIFVASLQVDGIEQLDRSLLMAPRSIAGQPFSEYNVAVDRDAILAQYFEKGFPTPPSSGVQARRPPNTVDLRYTVAEGQAQFVREWSPQVCAPRAPAWSTAVSL